MAAVHEFSAHFSRSSLLQIRSIDLRHKQPYNCAKLDDRDFAFSKAKTLTKNPYGWQVDILYFKILLHW